MFLILVTKKTAFIYLKEKRVFSLGIVYLYRFVGLLQNISVLTLNVIIITGKIYLLGIRISTSLLKIFGSDRVLFILSLNLAYLSCYEILNGVFRSSPHLPARLPSDLDLQLFRLLAYIHHECLN